MEERKKNPYRRRKTRIAQLSRKNARIDLVVKEKEGTRWNLSSYSRSMQLRWLLPQLRGRSFWF